MSPTVVRLRQGLRALFAFAQPVDRRLAAAYLSPELLTLFNRLSRGEQQHSLNVLRAVLAQAATPDPLAAAALLHDVGKIHYRQGVWQKTLTVIVRTCLPGLFRRWSQAVPGHWWTMPFVTYVYHPAWGAALAAHAGAADTLIWLIEHHADPLTLWAGHPHESLLARLQQADEAN
jgi:hypothetical protein